MSFLRSITLDNVLSFGPNTEPLKLQDLNLFIGPNAAGKSNLIEAISLLRAAPSSPSGLDVRGVVRQGGGVGEWLWKGQLSGPVIGKVNALLEGLAPHKPLRHLLSFRDDQGFCLDDESIENEKAMAHETDVYFYYRFQKGKPVVNTTEVNNKESKRRFLARETIDSTSSILAQRRDPELYPELTYLAENYEKVRIYREWGFGRNTVVRQPQRSDMRNDRLEEDFSNLGLVLSRLRRNPQTKNKIVKELCALYDGVTDFEVNIVEGGSVQVLMTEGMFNIPATRLSDGTMRYLCLLAILCDPSPPPLICIEEPELGLHPDILPRLADLLVDASERTQLIVTTHSDVLVDCMTDRPDCVVVCEKHDGKTEMHRLSNDKLKVWLENYRLGQLWSMGHLGGNRN